MKKVLLFSLLFTLCACKNKLQKIKESQVPKKDSVTVIKKIVKDEPTYLFKKLTEKLFNEGWNADTLRLKKLISYGHYSAFKLFEIKHFDNIPFYKLKSKESILSNNDMYFPYSENKKIDVSVFKNIKGWGYFYSKKDGPGSSTKDGVIEQWNFKNKSDAKKGKEILLNFYPLPYFNTSPYYYVIENKLIIFHTRAMFFSYEQKKHYEKLIKLSK